MGLIMLYGAPASGVGTTPPRAHNVAK
jgi:hypothetical protein